MTTPTISLLAYVLVCASGWVLTRWWGRRQMEQMLDASIIPILPYFRTLDVPDCACPEQTLEEFCDGIPPPRHAPNCPWRARMMRQEHA